MSLTFEEKQLIRKARDQAARARLRRSVRGVPSQDAWETCGACGAPRHEYNLDCETCRRRKLRHEETPWGNCDDCGKSISKDTMRLRKRTGSQFYNVPVCRHCTLKCSWCKRPVNEKTEGCHRCSERHQKRHQAQAERSAWVDNGVGTNGENRE